MAKALRIEVVSDVICPWCFIGTMNLEKALALRPDVAAEVVFQPFRLDPTTPPEGADLRERLRTKYGADPEAMFARVESVARAAGIELDFKKVRRTPNTRRAHVLLEHVQDASKRAKLAKALFAAYFLEGKDISDVDVLVSLAKDHGQDDATVRALLTDEGELAKIQVAAAEQASRGIRGVPFFVFNDRLGVSGAQPPEILCQAMDQALAGG